MKKIRTWFKKNKKKIVIGGLAAIVVAGTVIVAIPKPANAEGLKVSDSTYSTAAISWDKAEHAKKYKVYRSEDGENYECLGSTESNSFVDKGLKTGATYYYAVQSKNWIKSGKMEKEKPLSVTPSLETPDLDVDTSDGDIKLSYDEVDGAIGYQIIRDGEVIDTSGDTSYTDADAKGDKEYSYEVKAYRYIKDPVYSEASDTVEATLHCIKGLEIKPEEDDLELTWKESKYYDNYKIYNKDELLGETSENKFVIDDCDVDETYQLKITGFGKDESQSPDLEKSIKVVEVPQDNQGAIDAAVEWGIKIANDDSFTYGTGKRSHRYGCYFCQTNVGPRKNIKGKSKVNGHSYEKTYCCNPFVHACYAHGAQDPAMLKACRSGHGIAMTKKSFTRYGCWKSVGKVSRSNLKKGDVLVRSNHVMMYIGDGKIVHAAGGGWDAGSIRVKKLGGSKYSFVMRYTGNGSGTKRVVRDVDEDGNMIDKDGNPIDAEGNIIEKPEEKNDKDAEKSEEASEKKESEKNDSKKEEKKDQ